MRFLWRSVFILASTLNVQLSAASSPNSLSLEWLLPAADHPLSAKVGAGGLLQFQNEIRKLDILMLGGVQAAGEKSLMIKFFETYQKCGIFIKDTYET